MLTDVFVNRYEERPIWTSYGERERRFLVQASKIITEQVFPFYVNGEISSHPQSSLQLAHDKLAMEIGVDPLSPLYLGSFKQNIAAVIGNFLKLPFQSNFDVDYFMKNRISLVEIVLRERSHQVAAANEVFPIELIEAEKPSRSSALRNILFSKDSLIKYNTNMNLTHEANVYELNERLRQARFPLSYNNGFIQITGDLLTSSQIEQPFWAIVDHQDWNNVSQDMAEALDLRDNGGKNPALYAAKALESTIKIISGKKEWNRGNEKGASQYVDNLVSQANGRFIAPWEAEFLKKFFSDVRNPLGHGAGGEIMPELTEKQTDWAIETCMSWIKSLITRL